MGNVLVLFLGLLALFFTSVQSAQAQSLPELEPEPVHWGFASIFGTGWYQLDENRSVYVLRMPVRFALKTPELGSDGWRGVGVDLHLPITLGWHRLGDLSDIFDAENYQTVSFTPGIELEIPVSNSLYLRPFIKAGYGVDFGGGDDAWLVNMGLKSRYHLPTRTSNWDLLANVYWAAYWEHKGDDNDAVAGLMVGAERHHSMDQWNLEGHLHMSYTHLISPLDYLDLSRQGASEALDGYFTLGFSLSPIGRAYDFPLYQPHQLGLAIEFDADGDYLALKFNTRSWFTQ